jgi:hypothetical protein
MENEDIKYDGHATIVINESDSAWDEHKPKLMSAQDISTGIRTCKKFSQTIMDMKNNLSVVQEYILENYEDMGLHAQEIADLLEIELTKEVSVTVTVEFEVQLSLKPDEDLDDIITNLEYSIDRTDEVTDYYTGDVTWQES